MTATFFVFGSDLAGRHFRGAALYAMEVHGAVYGQSLGRQGNAFALPVEGQTSTPLTLAKIEGYAYLFLTYAAYHPDTHLELTPVGCGPGGHGVDEVAPLFAQATPNVLLPPAFAETLGRLKIDRF